MEHRRGRDSIVVAQVYYPYYSPPAVAQFPHGSLNDVQTLQTNVAPYFSNGGTKNKHSKAERVIPLQVFKRQYPQYHLRDGVEQLCRSLKHRMKVCDI